MHGLEESHHYCFICRVSVITDHKPLVAIYRMMLQAYHTAAKNTIPNLSIHYMNIVQAWNTTMRQTEIKSTWYVHNHQCKSHTLPYQTA